MGVGAYENKEEMHVHACMCVPRVRQHQSDAPFCAVKIPILTWRRDTALISGTKCFRPSVFVLLSFFSSPAGSHLFSVSETSSLALQTQILLCFSALCP